MMREASVIFLVTGGLGREIGGKTLTACRVADALYLAQRKVSARVAGIAVLVIPYHSPNKGRTVCAETFTDMYEV